MGAVGASARLSDCETKVTKSTNRAASLKNPRVRIFALQCVCVRVQFKMYRLRPCVKGMKSAHSDKLN